MPTVSIVMPCYNDGQYILDAVASCYSQDYADWELIIVDDGSSDGQTLSVLKSLPDERISVIRTSHVGPSAARNTAISRATGKYILPLDADDCIGPDYIGKAVQVLEKQAEVGIVYCHAELFGMQQGPWQLPDFAMEHFLVDNCIFITALFRKSDWEKVGGFCTQFRYGLEDYDFWLSLIQLGRQVVQLPETMFYYRIKPVSRSVSLNQSISNANETYALLYRRHKELFQQHMDAYCLGLRRALIEQKAMTGSSGAYANDPVSHYWHTIRLLKPRLAKRVEKLVVLKDRFKKELGK